MRDQGHTPSSASDDESLKTGPPRNRRIGRQFSRRAAVVGVALALVIPGGAALASVVTGSGLGNPAKLASQAFQSSLHASSRASAAATVYSSVSAQSTVTKKPLRCKKGKVKKTKRVHGKKVTVCVPKKKVKAVHVRRPPSFTG